jgi:glycosidase
MLIRSIRWEIDQTHCDGFRLDAVKHVPSYFFGQQSGNKDPSSSGYLGRAQAQFNLTHGYTGLVESSQFVLLAQHGAR